MQHDKLVDFNMPKLISSSVISSPVRKTQNEKTFGIFVEHHDCFPDYYDYL